MPSEPRILRRCLLARRTLAFACWVCVSALGWAEPPADWGQWRGPNRDGVSTETDWSTDWPESGPTILWNVKLAENANNRDGSSAVAVSGDRVYAVGTGFAYCLQAKTGKTLWKTPFSASHSTPTVDGERVYIYGTQGEFACLEFATGKTVWSKRMQKDFGAGRAGAYGYAASPLVIDDVVLVSARIGEGALVALDKRTGELRWKADHAGHKGYAFWSSPVVATIEEMKCIVWLAGPSVVGLDPSDGKTLWKYEIPPEKGKVGCAAATPVISGNRIVAQYHPPHARGYTFCLEIQDGKAKEVWRDRTLANWYFSCIGYNGRLYGMDQSPRNRNREERDIGMFHCHDIATGKLLWSINGFGQSGTRPVRHTRKHPPAGTFVVADGKLISWGEELVVAELTENGHKVLCSAKLPVVGYRTMPVLAGGRLFLRTGDGHLLCLDVRKR